MLQTLFLIAALTAADVETLSRIKPRMQAHVDHGVINGTVTMLVEKGQTVHIEATGWADKENKKPMRKDSIFQIMSMTKPITGTAIMMMVEAGKLNLNDPVAKYLPEFKDKPNVLVRQLMTHTSGMATNPPGTNMEWLYSMKVSLEDAVKFYATVPLLQDPGTKWVYSNMGLATLGRLIEVTSGMKYDEFIAKRLLQPLGMKDSFYFPPADKKDRIVVNYCSKDATLAPCPHTTLGGDSRDLRAGATYPAPEFGLYSTAEDLSHFLPDDDERGHAGRQAVHLEGKRGSHDDGADWRSEGRAQPRHCVRSDLGSGEGSSSCGDALVDRELRAWRRIWDTWLDRSG